ncbi:MAG: xylose reductase [Planctomycetes bacterium RBG_16_41_13]|nr:MAG: xylose reductase [Planctomycetes bacterium RBG_16_41_13]
MKIPLFIYGTAWKEDATFVLVKKAISEGFNAIDTANQPRHYQEALVGEALQSIFDEGIKRETLFLQTKFTPVDGHDQRIPYDKKADLATQVKQSFANSMEHLHTDYVDSYLLHGLYSSYGVGKSDWEVWQAIEDIHLSGKARMIGISNISREQLEILVAKAAIKPMVVQNRCFANQGWDRKVREYCSTHDILYQGFSLLTANTFLFQNSKIKKIARQKRMTIAQVLFRFALHVGIIPLTGTTDEQHMKEDLRIFDYELTKEEVQAIETIAG